MIVAAKPRPILSIWKSRSLAWPVPAIVLAMIARLVLLGMPAHGYDSFAYKHWTWRLVHEPLATFYIDDGQAFPDHLPGDLWLLKLVGELSELVNPGVNFYSGGYTIVIALLATSFDVLIAFALWRIGMCIGQEKAGVMAGIAYWCMPAPIFVASVWGQIGAISAGLAIVAMGFAIQQRFSIAFLMLTLCALVKPQYALLAMPILVGGWQSDRTNPGKWICRVAATATACLTLVALIAAPFRLSLAGEWGRWSVVDRVRLAADTYPVSSLGAHNLWGAFDPLTWPPGDLSPWLWVFSRQQVGLILFSLIFVTVFWAMFARWGGATTMVLGANVLMFGFFLVTTRMHERYLFPIVGLSILLALLDSRFWRYAIAANVLVFANISLRYVWTQDEASSGLPAVMNTRWLEHDWFIRLLVLLTFVTFGYLLRALLSKPVSSCP